MKTEFEAYLVENEETTCIEMRCEMIGGIFYDIPAGQDLVQSRLQKCKLCQSHSTLGKAEPHNCQQMLI